ncbi:MAG: diaminopimelate decarboxylase [Rhodospirillaceae bacterium]|nr:diaminopimelate decarboxylase [Rhodospirillaceae bacterium]
MLQKSIFAHREDISVVEISRRVGTPFYLYDGDRVASRFAAFDRAFGAYNHQVHYALKANSTLAIARIIKKLGGSVDANSGGEIDVALRAGFKPSEIIFTGVGKTESELRRAVELGVKAINVESVGELERIDQFASDKGVQASVAIRVNPDVIARTHPNISTGSRAHKFGVPIETARDACIKALQYDGVKVVGLHVHIGSQLLSVEPIRSALSVVASLANELLDRGCPLEHFDVGGGLGIAYDGSDSLDVDEYAATVIDSIASTGLILLTEPGRWIVGPTGVLIARVVDVKPKDSDRYFVVLDAGMSELLRPALYGAFHRLELLEPRDRVPVSCDVVGPICETSDVLGEERVMPLPEVGDLVAVMDAGAYGATMASNYNRHPLPAEVIIEKDGWRIVRRRQTIEDMLQFED